MKDRILKLIKEERITAAEFADKLGVQRSSVSHILNGRNNPGYSFIQKIMEVYPAVNPRWLLTGNGAIYESDKDRIQASPRIATDLFADQSGIKQNEDNRVNVEKEKVTAEVNQTISESIPLSTTTNTSRKIKRVMIFFDDHTFEDFYPADKI